MLRTSAQLVTSGASWPTSNAQRLTCCKMNDRVMQFRVGVVVLATLIIGALLMTLNSPLPQGWLPWGSGTYEILIELNEAPGIGPNTPVRKNGLLIGRVGSVDDLNDRVVVKVNIDDNRPLFAQYTPVVRTTVLGDSTIDFVTRPVPAGTPALAGGTVMRGRVEPNPLESLAEFTDLKGELQRTIDSLGRAGDEVAKLASRVNTAFGDETESGRVDRLLDTTERAMRELGNAAASFNELFGESMVDSPQMTPSAPPASPQGGGAPRGFQTVFNQLPGPNPTVLIEEDTSAEHVLGRTTAQRLKQGLNEFPELMRDARLTLQDMRETLDLADKNLRNIEGFTEPLGRNGEQIAQSIIEGVQGLEQMVEEFTVLGKALNSREGTLGQLLHNPQLYRNANQLLCNVNDVVLRVNELTFMLKPVIGDARIFMDKIATEPGRIVGGAVRPSVIK